jgi:hypothetical protein
VLPKAGLVVSEKGNLTEVCVHTAPSVPLVLRRGSEGRRAAPICRVWYMFGVFAHWYYLHTAFLHSRPLAVPLTLLDLVQA